MVDPLTFFKALGLTIIVIFMVAVVMFWVLYYISINWGKVRLFFKVKVFKKINEKYFQYAYEGYHGGLSRGGLAKRLYIHGTPIRNVDEILYYYDYIRKGEMKGGKN